MLINTLLIVVVLLVGYTLMSTKYASQLSRAAVAMFCGVIAWIVYMLHGGDFLMLVHPEEYSAFLAGEESCPETVKSFISQSVIMKYIGEACSVILFLIATNTIVEVMNNNGLFDSLITWLRMRNSKKFLWIISLLTFGISANVDNLTTVVLMVTIMSQIVQSHSQKVIYACAILVAANLGGSFTVIGDMTSLMLWVRGVVTPSAFAGGLVLPVLASLCTFNLLLSKLLVGTVDVQSFITRFRGDESYLAPWQKLVLLVIGIAGLWAIPTFHAETHLPPFLGALCVLALIWLVEGIFNLERNGTIMVIQRHYLRNTEFIGIKIILYYLGITLGVGALTESGALEYVGEIFNTYIHNVYVYGLITGVFSIFIDNVPFVMTGLNIFQLDTAPDSTSDFVLNGNYWQLLSYCSAMGGSILYVGTLAGHAVVDVETIRFTWWCRHVVWRVLVAWAVGMIVFWLTHSLI